MSQPIVSDALLVQQFIEGSESAFEILIARYKSILLRCILKNVKNTTLSEDIFQETILKALVALRNGEYKEQGRFKFWIIRIARNQAIIHFRGTNKIQTISVVKNQQGREVEFICLLAETYTSTHNASNIIYHKNKIREMVKQLSPVNREAVLLKFYYKMSYKEIRELNGICVNTMTSRIKNAMTHLCKLANENAAEFAD